MHDDGGQIDYSIELQPLDQGRLRPRSKPQRRILLFALVGGAVMLSLATIFAFVMKVASVVRQRNTPVVVTYPRDADTNRVEAVGVFAAFDAYEDRHAQRSPELQTEREALASLLHKLEECGASADETQFRALVDFDRLTKRVELSGAASNWSQLAKRQLRSELMTSVEAKPTWAKLLLAGVVTPPDDANTRIVYAYGWNKTATDQTEHRLWMGRAGSAWKLYDWERLDLGLAESRRWGLYIKYHNSPLLDGHNRWTSLLGEVDQLTADGDTAGAKTKLRLAESQLTPMELSDFLWLLTGHRWLKLNEDSEAERCYNNVRRPRETPGAFLGLMNCKRWASPADALKFAQQYEDAVGPGPDVLTVKVQLLKQLGRNTQATDDLKKWLRIEPEDSQALAQLYLALPKDDKSEFERQLSRSEHPAATVESVAPSIGYSDYPGLLRMVDYLQREAPAAPGTLYVAGFAKSFDGQYEAAAKHYRQAYDSARDEKQRATYGEAYVRAMAANGDAITACDALADPKAALESLLSDYDEDDVTLTDDEYERLVEHFRARYPSDHNGILREAQLALQKERYADAERISRMGLEQLKTLKTEPANKTAKSNDEEDKYYPDALARCLAMAVYKQGRLQAAYQSGGQPEERFSQLANLAVRERKWGDVQALLALQRASHPEDWHLNLIEAELAAHEKRWDDAIRQLRTGLQTAIDQDRGPLKTRLWAILADSGKWRANLGSGQDESEAFEALARRFVDDENWESLLDLVWEHGRHMPNDPRAAKYLAAHAWAQKDWKHYIEYAEQALRISDSKQLSWYERDAMEDRFLSALLRTKNYLRARTFARSEAADRDRTSKLAIIGAASGDWAESQRLVRETATARESASRFYQDDDVGRLFLGEQFRDLQRDFPVQVPANATETLAVFLFDEPWSFDARQLSAALDQAGLHLESPLESPVKYPWTYTLHLNGGTMWFVIGAGVYEEKWHLKNATGAVAGAVNQGRAWLAVGVAGWTDSERKGVESLVRKTAQQLVGERAKAICVPNGNNYRAGSIALPAGSELLQAWQATGRLNAFIDQAEELKEVDSNRAAAANRQFDRGLWDAVRRFEATPGAKLTVTARLSTKPELDPLPLNVTTVKRNYGSLTFNGTLVSDSNLIRDLKAGLPMRCYQFQVSGWQLNNEERVDRP